MRRTPESEGVLRRASPREDVQRETSQCDPSSPRLADLADLPRRLAQLEAVVSELRAKVLSLESGPDAPLTVQQFCERYGWTENQLRWLLFNRNKNGLSEAVSGSGRLLIDAASFFEILKRGRGARRRVRRLR